MKKIISLICALMVVSGMALAQRGEPVVIPLWPNHQCCIFILLVVTDGAKVPGFITHANGKPSWKDGSLKNKRMFYKHYF